MASSPTITLIPPRLRFLAYRSSNSSSVGAASRFFHLSSSLPRSISAMSSSESSSTKTERVVIKGRVQGVFYRNWTIENATQLGLKGWVRNRKDGSVEALFSGSVDAVQEMEQRCRRGPSDALVTGIQVFPSDDDPGTGFHRKPTL
uniref:acylphosphatase n=2 Tax=Cajanus cajan TaxID=3821 RepID=A0A151R344_CAJCA|nr:Acylphosphatase [Cajanus cajan]